MARRVNGGIGIGFEEDGYFDDVGGSNGFASSSSSSSSFSSPSPPPSKHMAAVNSSPPSSAGGSNYIVHHVSKFDTLAGVAIKYGVEVADIRRINGLVTDLQMFGLKTLRIPLPGRHQPSPILSNGLDAQGESSSEKTPSQRRHSDLFDTFQSLKLMASSQQDVLPSISSLQDHYGLKTVDEKSISEGFEMTAYRNGGAHYLEDGPLAKSSSPNRPLSLHRKCKSVANGLMSENGDLAGQGSAKESKDRDSDKWINRLLVRRRQKCETDFNSSMQSSLKEEENRSGGTFSAIMLKGFGLPKTVNGFLSGADAEAGDQNPNPVSFGESFIANVVNGFRKSSSTSSLLESDNNTLLSLWPTSKWSLKPDLNARSTTAITRPIFDGIPNPISGRKNKAAVD